MCYLEQKWFPFVHICKYTFKYQQHSLNFCEQWLMFKENSDMELKTVCKLLGLREFLRMRENRKDTDFFFNSKITK